MKLTKGEIKFLRELIEVMLEKIRMNEIVGVREYEKERIIFNNLLEKLL